MNLSNATIDGPFFIWKLEKKQPFQYKVYYKASAKLLTSDMYGIRQILQEGDNTACDYTFDEDEVKISFQTLGYKTPSFMDFEELEIELK